MTRARVCFVVESGTDARLVDGLADHCDVTVVARCIEGGVAISQPLRSNADVRLGPSSIGGFAAHAFGFLRREGRRFDFVLVQGYGAAALAARTAAGLHGIRSALLVCSPVESYYKCRVGQEGYGKPYRAHEYAALRLLAGVNARTGADYIVLSSYLADVVAAHGARRHVDIVPVYGVDTAVFRPLAEPRASVRRRRGLPEQGSLLFFSSRMAPEKDAGTLLEAVRLLVTQGRDVRVLHRSGGYERFSREAERCGLGDRVIATDAVHPHDELPFDYAASDLCVQASRDEGLGYSVLEALACGVPVVASAVGGLRETIVDGETGWTCPPRDPAAMARAIASALDDTVESVRRAEAGRRMVVERFERSRVFGRLLALIAERTA